MSRSKIDLQTIEFIDFLNILARESEHGIRPFSTATPQDKDGLWYDNGNPSPSDLRFSYPLICRMLVDENHHDIISTWTEEYKRFGIQFNVVMDDDNENEPYVFITFDDDELCIAIENGTWYTC
jgi:hypothetical protein